MKHMIESVTWKTRQKKHAGRAVKRKMNLKNEKSQEAFGITGSIGTTAS